MKSEYSSNKEKTSVEFSGEQVGSFCGFIGRIRKYHQDPNESAKAPNCS